MKDRVVRLFEILSSTDKRLKIKLLAEMLDVSFVTARKDIEILERRGIVSHSHGYVSFEGANETGRRIALNYLVKRRIAKAACLTIEEGELIMMESGSCCAILAEELAFAKKNINIVTNSVFLANYVYKLKNLKITLLSGHLQPESQVLVGPMTKKCAEQLYSQKIFMGTDGFIPEYGFTGRDQLRIETVVELAKQAESIFILTEAAKFRTRGSFKLIQFDKLRGVFTDDSIPKEAEAILVKNNVKVYKVPAIEERLKWRRGQTPFVYFDKF